MSVLVIAEKPSVANTVATVLGANKKGVNYLYNDRYIVSWCLGHLVKLDDPIAYGDRFAEKPWKFENLPIIPEKWKFSVGGSTKSQYYVLKSLIERDDVNEIVCATDAGRERSRQEQTADTDKLYPQIAEALNISISQLEQYPSDMKQILCQAYINNCELGKDDVAEALNGIVNLDIDEVGIKEIEKQQDNTAVDNELRQTEVTERKNKRSYLLSRNQILQNARTIADSDKSKQYDRQQPENITRNNNS